MPAYFDHNATTPLDPRVLDAMLPWLEGRHGNPSSVHSFGQQARAGVETARAQVAALLAAEPPEVIFCASGTEANNAVMFSVARQCGFDGQIVIAALEHPSIHAAAAILEEAGMRVARVAPGTDGVVSAAALLAALDEDTRLLCLMLANNEVGTMQPVAEVARACRERGVPVLCDAVQAIAKVPVDVKALGVDFLSLGAHKFHGPLGAAGLWVRPGVELLPLLVGGSQERHRRASTVNVPAAVGLGRACELAAAELDERGASLAALRDRFEAGLSAIPDSFVHCAASARLPNTSYAAFPGVEAQALMIRLDLAGFAVSTGSACSSGKVELSTTMKAMGTAPEVALSSLRVSFGITNTAAEVDGLLAALATEVAALRGLADTAAAGRQ